MISSVLHATCAQVLQELLGSSFFGMAADCVGERAEACVAQLQPGQVCVLLVLQEGAQVVLRVR